MIQIMSCLQRVNACLLGVARSHLLHRCLISNVKVCYMYCLDIDIKIPNED